MAKRIFIQLCLAASFSSVSVAKTTITSGGGGQQCGDIKCLYEDGMCVTDARGNKTCQCDPGYKNQVQGDGTLACYKKNKRYAFIYSEPIVQTYDGYKYNLNLPCRVMATKFISRLKLATGPNNVVGECECELFTWQRKHKGKFFPHGFDAACRMVRTDTDPHNVTGFSVRKYGEASYGVYTFTEEGVNEFLPNGPWTNDSVAAASSRYLRRHGLNPIITECEYNEQNNIALIDQWNCGLRVELKPFDTKKGRYQTQPNGIAWAINCANHPELKDLDNTIVSGPGENEHSGHAWRDMYTSTLLTADEFWLHKALVSDVEQNHPDSSVECQELKDSALVCDSEEKVKTAMDQCKWLLHSQPFIKCVDPTDNGDVILGLVRRCFDQACGTMTCDAFFSHLVQTLPFKCIDTPMLNKVSKLRMWMDYDFC